jgi:hypothetical protein
VEEDSDAISYSDVNERPEAQTVAAKRDQQPGSLTGMQLARHSDDVPAMVVNQVRAGPIGPALTIASRLSLR